MAVAVVAVDQLTKWWALEALAPGSCAQPGACIDLILGARFNLVFNNGAAFARGTGFGPLLGVVAFFMAGVLLYLATKRPDRFGQILFGAVAGGAVGNLIDRIFRADDGPLSGAVVDFIDLGWWPVFNIADSAIVVGVVGIIAHAFIVGEPEAPGAEGPADGGSDDDVDQDGDPDGDDVEDDDPPVGNGTGDDRRPSPAGGDRSE
ncbi:MAG: signal peptidase II [Actinomycetota bacterium]